MKFLCVIHLYLPRHGAGGETYIHNFAKYLISKGHEVRVLLTEASHYNIEQIYEYEGVTVVPVHPNVEPIGSFNWCDCVFTHLGPTVWACKMAHIFKKPCFFVSHNTHKYAVVDAMPEVAVVYNSHAMADQLKYANPSCVLHPAVDYRVWDFGGPVGDCITLINLNRNKGGMLFLNIARAMPERKFLGVVGSYDPQMFTDCPENMELVANNPDMEPVYRRTRILLCPSKYESWGMCASEAMANGIPIIYNPTFGLLENVGEAGIQVKDINPDYGTPEELLKGGESDGIDPVLNVPGWMKAIKRLDSLVQYRMYSKRSRERSRELDPIKELQAFEEFVINYQPYEGEARPYSQAAY